MVQHEPAAVIPPSTVAAAPVCQQAGFTAANQPCRELYIRVSWTLHRWIDMWMEGQEVFLTRKVRECELSGKNLINSIISLKNPVTFVTRLQFQSFQ